MEALRIILIKSMFQELGLHNSDIESLLNYNAADGKSEADYVPTNNVILVNQGISPTNSVSTGASSNDTLDDLVPHTNVGSNADIGAFEYGATAWSAGIDWTPKFRRAVWKTDAGSTIGTLLQTGPQEMYRLLMFTF